MPHQKNLRRGRFSQPGQIYHITFAAADRTRELSFQSRTLIARHLYCQELMHGAKPLAWVVMPDHVHVLLQLEHETLSRAVQSLKSKTAWKINQQTGRVGKLWQPGFHDHALRDDECMKSIARYIVLNPVRAGLVKRVGDYPFWNAIWF